MSGTPRLRLELRPSRTLSILILGAHALAAACAILLMQNFVGAFLAAALLALGAASAWSRALLRSGGSVRALDIALRAIDAAPGALEVESTDGRRFPAEAAGRRYVGRLAVMLPLRRPLGRPFARTVLVTADMLDPAAFRRLRLWALWGKLPSVAGLQRPAAE